VVVVRIADGLMYENDHSRHSVRHAH